MKLVRYLITAIMIGLGLIAFAETSAPQTIQQTEKTASVSANITPATAQTHVDLAFKDGDVNLDGQMFNMIVVNDPEKFSIDSAFKALKESSGHVYALATDQQRKDFLGFMSMEQSQTVQAAKETIGKNTTIVIARQQSAKQIASNNVASGQTSHEAAKSGGS